MQAASKNRVRVEHVLNSACPGLNSALSAYIAGYFLDGDNLQEYSSSSSERAGESGVGMKEVLDFLCPLLQAGGQGKSGGEASELAARLFACANGLDPALDTHISTTAATTKDMEIDPISTQQYHLTPLPEPVCIADVLAGQENAVSNAAKLPRTGDIRHTFSANGPRTSLVDQRKLRLAEKRIQEKRDKRGLYQPDEIFTWNPDIKPAIIVNQMKLAASLGVDGNSRSKDIKLENFDIQYAGKPILANANLTLSYGKRYGMVGKNGVGKSTLLRAIAHRELLIPAHIRILHVEQEIAGDDTSAIKSVLEADEEREALLSDEKRINSLLSKGASSPEESALLTSQLKDVYSKLEDIESDKAESRASAILSGLGFNSQQQLAATRTFSGGWRMRLALARALFCRPDLLLADEVTNYLDFPAVVWLENYFQNWHATLLVVSHDRSFLESVSTDILHMHNGKLDYYKGPYSNFVTTRDEKRRNTLREYESQLAYRQHLQDFIDRWRYNAKRAAQAQSKIKLLEKLPPLIAPSKDDMEGLGVGQDSVYFTFPDPEKLSPPILQMDSVTFAYPGTTRTILKDVSFDLRLDSKIAVVGPNGAGKSTMIYLLTGQHQPSSGLCHRSSRLRFALFSQHFVDQLVLGMSSVQYLASKFPGMKEEEYRAILGRFGLTGTTGLQPIGTLSGGQKSRVVFASMAMLNPHVLILDEPTNHLDMDSIDALARALRQFKGGVAIVSHDQQFLDAVCNEVWVCANGILTRFEGKAGVVEGVVEQYKKSLVYD